MKKPLEILSNKLYKNEMQVLFGENFKIKIDEFTKLSQNQTYSVHAKLIINNPDILVENYSGIDTTVEDDVCYYITNCCKFMGISKQVMVITSIEFN